jgi:two-component system, cell cycle sensor histidine kinase and response regulator CckA
MKAMVDRARREAHTPPNFPRKLILLVEDDLSVRLITRRFLEDDRYEVLVADGPLQALSILDKTSPRVDLLLTDIVMPGMNGRQLAELVRRREPDVKVLFTTGYVEDTIARYGVDRRACSVLQKPFSRWTLSTTVRSVLA